MYMHAITNLGVMKRKHLRCVSRHCMTYLIACICITRNKLDLSCNAMKHILGVSFSLHIRLVIACIYIWTNKLDMSCNALKHALGVFFLLHRG